eukprot:g675.t1
MASSPVADLSLGTPAAASENSAPAWWTPCEEISKKHASLEKTFNEGLVNDVEFRKEQIRRVQCMLQEKQQALFEAIRKDVGRHPAHSALVHRGCVGACQVALDNIDEWVRPISKGVQKVGPVPGAECEVRFCPVGVALVVGTWNFPMPLILKPLVSAIAAGNP